MGPMRDRAGIAQAAPPALKCKGLVRSIGTKRLVGPIDLEVAPGEFVVISGPSGAGKTTLLRLVAGLDRPTEGTIQIEGRCMSSPSAMVSPARRGVGMVFERPALWPHLTVEQHLALVLKGCRRFGRAQRRERIEMLLERLQLVELRRRFPHDLSAGERSRVAIARSLAPGPRLLLLDEPLAHLDVHLADDLAAVLLDIHRRESLTTLAAMHRPEAVIPAVSRFVVLEDGRIVSAGARSEIIGSAERSEFTSALARLLDRDGY